MGCIRVNGFGRMDARRRGIGLLESGTVGYIKDQLQQSQEEELIALKESARALGQRKNQD
jgi:hypothetical protein